MEGDAMICGYSITSFVDGVGECSLFSGAMFAASRSCAAHPAHEVAGRDLVQQRHGKALQHLL